MIKLEFKNAVVEDRGYGVMVNGKELERIISTALGTRAGSAGGYGSGLPEFKSNCCNVTVIIDPQPVTTVISDEKHVNYRSVEALEKDAEAKYERIKAKATQESAES